MKKSDLIPETDKDHTCICDVRDPQCCEYCWARQQEKKRLMASIQKDFKDVE